MIDLGIVEWAKSANRSDTLQRMLAWIPYQEYLISPELALELTKPEYSGNFRHIDCYLPHDIREVCQWHFGVLTYLLTHGYAPWETPEWDPAVGYVFNWDSGHRGVNSPKPQSRVRLTPEERERREQEMQDRRARIINEELPIDENLSQDCVDALRVMLAKNPEDRGNFEELASMPWFQGHWVDRDVGVRPGYADGQTCRVDQRCW